MTLILNTFCQVHVYKDSEQHANYSLLDGIWTPTASVELFYNLQIVKRETWYLNSQQNIGATIFFTAADTKDKTDVVDIVEQNVHAAKTALQQGE